MKDRNTFKNFENGVLKLPSKDTGKYTHSIYKSYQKKSIILLKYNTL